MRYLLLTLLIIFCTSFTYKEQNKVILLKGKVVNAIDEDPLYLVHIINKRTLKGTITNENGYFEIEMLETDTIYFSIIGFKNYTFTQPKDREPYKEISIRLVEEITSLNDVELKALNLTGDIETDVKNMEFEEKKPLSVPGYKTKEDLIAEFGSLDSPEPGVMQPVDFLYSIFGKRPKQLRKLKTLEDADREKEIMMKRYDREIVKKLTGLERAELEKLARLCNLSTRFINEANDFDFLNAVEKCYEDYKKLVSEDYFTD